jgi:ABC-type multidrug transport system permease subunit
MGGYFTPKDPVRCPHYALFASHLERWQFDILYWTLFAFNLMVLFFASWFYIR